MVSGSWFYGSPENYPNPWKTSAYTSLPIDCFSSFSSTLFASIDLFSEQGELFLCVEILYNCLETL